MRFNVLTLITAGLVLYGAGASIGGQIGCWKPGLKIAVVSFVLFVASLFIRLQ